MQMSKVGHARRPQPGLPKTETHLMNFVCCSTLDLCLPGSRLDLSFTWFRDGPLFTQGSTVDLRFTLIFHTGPLFAQASTWTLVCLALPGSPHGHQFAQIHGGH